LKAAINTNPIVHQVQWGVKEDQFNEKRLCNMFGQAGRDMFSEQWYKRLPQVARQVSKPLLLAFVQ
jgi:hypothetical protein